MAKPKTPEARPPEAFGLALCKSPDGNYVLVAGPVDLSRSASLSPRWVRELNETRPKRIQLPPDPHNGHIATVVTPVLTRVGQTTIYGEALPRALRRANKELGKLANAALLAQPTPADVLDGLRHASRPPQKPNVLPPEAARIHAERALGFLGKPDMHVERELKKLGRSPAQIAEYLKARHPRAA